MGLDAWLVSFALVCLFRFVFVSIFAAGKPGDDHFAAT